MCVSVCVCVCGGGGGYFSNFVYWLWMQVDNFVRKVMQGQASFYGFTQETLDSLMLTLLPPIGHEYQQAPLKPNTADEGMDKQVLLLKSLLDALQKNAGFHIPKVLVSPII